MNRTSTFRTTIHTTFRLAVFGSAMLLAGTGIATAQQAPPAAASQSQMEVSDQQLQTFASAQEALVEIQEDYSEKMQNADDPDAANALRAEANEEMVSAVQESGLDVETFNAIAMAVQNDPSLQQKLQDMR